MGRFLVDESLPRAVSRTFAAAGHDVVDARDAGLRGRPDEEVFRRAVTEQRILLSGDVDFANTLRFPPQTHPGIVVLRVPEEWPSQRRAQRLLDGVGEADLDQAPGTVVIVEPSRCRIFGMPSAKS